MINRLIRFADPRPLATIDPIDSGVREDAWGIQDADKRWVRVVFADSANDDWLERQPDGIYWVWHWHRGHFCCVRTYVVNGGNITELAIRRRKRRT